MNTLAKRWVTALVAGPLVILLIIYGSNLFFAVFIGLLVVLAVIEYGRMCLLTQTDIAVGILSGLIIAAGAYSGKLLAGSVSAATVLAILFFLFRNCQNREDGSPDISILGKMILGFIAIPLLIVHLLMIRMMMPDGMKWILLLFVIAVSGDVSAFYIGRSFGKKKLMPKVSPAKTWEGAIASVVGSILAALCFQSYFMPYLQIHQLVILSGSANILAQLGDLSESLIKRSAGVKDSGFLFPGHGGVLDRLDAFLLSAPFLYYYKVLVIG